MYEKPFFGYGTPSFGSHRDGIEKWLTGKGVSIYSPVNPYVCVRRLEVVRDQRVLPARQVQVNRFPAAPPNEVHVQLSSLVNVSGHAGQIHHVPAHRTKNSAVVSSQARLSARAGAMTAAPFSLSTGISANSG